MMPWEGYHLQLEGLALACGSEFVPPSSWGQLCSLGALQRAQRNTQSTGSNWQAGWLPENYQRRQESARN